MFGSKVKIDKTLLEKASRGGSREATANLAALFYVFGYERDANRIMSGATGVNTSSPDVHPGVRKMLAELQ